MAQFTQLGLSGKPEGKPEGQTSQNVARADQSPRSNKNKLSKQTTAAFVGSVTAASLLAIFLLQAGGCSKEKGKSTVLAPPAQTTSNQQAPLFSTTANSTPVPAVSQPQAPKKVVKKRPSTVTYSDQTYGVSFSYPRWYTLKAGDDAKSNLAAAGATPMNFVQPGGVTVVAVGFPNKSYAGTDFASGSFNVSVNKNLTPEQCDQFAVPLLDSSDKSAVQATKVKLGDLELGEVENLSGDETRQADAKYYHVFENGSCYEFALGMTTSGDQTDDGIKPVDRAVVFGHLEKILASVKIKPEAAPEVNASVPAAPAVSLSTPALPPAPDTTAK